MNSIKHEVVAISDLHLGSNLCQSKELLEFLKRLEVKRLILNGDVFEDLKKTFRLNRQHWDILQQLRSMSDHCEVVWILGNHDSLYGNKKENIIAISNLLGIKMKYQAIIKIGNKSCLFIHGDKWDTYIYKYPKLSNIITWIYDRLKDMNGKFTRELVKWIKRKSKMLMRNSEFVMDGAINYAEDLECDLVVCGHTHHAMLEKKDSIIYGNCGTFESFVPTYITIDENNVGLWKYENGESTIIRELK